MIGYYTDNNVSHTVMKAVRRAGIEVDHIGNFDAANDKTPIFYGILRGAGSAALICKHLGKDFYYIDNGYYDAVYMDVKKNKDMTGKYRVVKNGMNEPFTGKPASFGMFVPEMRALLLPPSPYTAFMNDTTPEDWNQRWVIKCQEMGWRYHVRDKSEQKPINKHMKEFDIVIAFNSMGIMTAIEEGKYAYDTHGILRNDEMIGWFLPQYDLEEIKQFYEPKNLTLAEIAEGKWIN